MVLGIGIDVVDQARISKAYRRFGKRFLERILTDSEIEFCMKRTDPIPAISARFAAKEATYKALGPAPNEIIPFEDVEVQMVGRRPEIVLSGTAQLIADDMGVGNIFISISHDAGVAVAVVVLSK